MWMGGEGAAADLSQPITITWFHPHHAKVVAVRHARVGVAELLSNVGQVRRPDRKSCSGRSTARRALSTLLNPTGTDSSIHGVGTTHQRVGHRGLAPPFSFRPHHTTAPDSTFMAPKITVSPKRGRIYWTAFTELEGASQPTDPLRFDMYTERLGNLLLPGLTNRTERLRYLSMVCAGIGVTGGSRSPTVREQRQAFLPFERGWALAMTIAVDGELKMPYAGPSGRALKPEFRGLRGVNRVLAHYRTVRDEYATRPTNYVLLKGQDSQGGLGAYLVTLREFGFVQRDSLRLTALGRELADAFDPKLRGAPLASLVERSSVPLRTLERLGEQLTLGAPGATERQIVKGTIFGDRGQVAECMRRGRRVRPNSRNPRVLLRAIGRRDGDPLARHAQYAVDFDPMRVALLQLFCRLGTALRGHAGAVRLTALLSDQLDEAAARAQVAARHLAGSEARGLEPVSALARDIAAGEGTAHVIQRMIAFHRREGRAWITSDRPDRYALGHHGSFDEPPDEFNGYTLGRALQLLHDAEGSA
jgi:hypothetical protein